MVFCVGHIAGRVMFGSSSDYAYVKPLSAALVLGVRFKTSGQGEADQSHHGSSKVQKSPGQPTQDQVDQLRAHQRAVDTIVQLRVELGRWGRHVALGESFE